MDEYLESLTVKLGCRMNLRKVKSRLNNGEPQTSYFVKLERDPNLDTITRGVNLKLPESMEIEIEVPERAYELLSERKAQLERTTHGFGAYAVLSLDLGTVLRK